MRRATSSTRSSSTTRADAAVLALALAAACTGGGEPLEQDTVDEEFEVKALVADWAADLEAGRIAALRDRMDEAFLHQGEDLDRVEEWCRYFLEAGGALRVVVEDIDVSLPGHPSEEQPDGAAAEVAYTLTIERAGAEGDPRQVLLVQRAVPGLPQAWLSHLEKRDGRWVPVGDRKPFGISLVSLHDGPRFTLGGGIRDPRGRLRGGTLTGRGAEGGVPLALLPSGIWAPAAEVELAATPEELPALPLPYALALDTVDGPVEELAEVRAAVTEFATPTRPLGDADVPIVFEWQAAEDRFRRFQVRVLGAAGTLWISEPTLARSLSYQGPELELGTSYDYEVRVLDSFGDASIARASFVPRSPDELTPALASVSPDVGPAAGGQRVVIEGERFGDGLRILFGTEEATDVAVISSTRLEATTPAGAPGVVAVAAVTPAGRTALLERAYTYE